MGHMGPVEGVWDVIGSIAIRTQHVTYILTDLLAYSIEQSPS